MKKLSVVLVAVICFLISSGFATAAEVNSQSLDNSRIIELSDEIDKKSKEALLDDRIVTACINVPKEYADDWDLEINTKDITESLPLTQMMKDAIHEKIGHTYIITAKASNLKYESDTKDINKKKIKASMHLTMVWNDVFGANNILKKIYGSCEISKGTLDKGTVSWGTSSVTLDATKKVGNSNFEFFPNYTSKSGIGNLYARYNLYFKEDSYNAKLEVHN